jgi:diguanylate cyclase (GGDEF)-like protein/PAS domain S-box-containing protein
MPVEADKVPTIIRNISVRKQAELALAESERRYRLVTENMTDLVALHQTDSRFAYVTPSCQTLLGYTQAELIGRLPTCCLHPEDQDRVKTAFAMALQEEPLPVTYRFRTKTGRYIWLETLMKAIKDDTGQVLHLQTTSRDVSDRIYMEQRLRHDALHDALTGLPNRHLLMERLELALKRTKRHPEYQVAVLFLDFDNFKVINDSLGHAAGDQLLTTLAPKLTDMLRETDLVARIGGDEFVILLEDLDTINEAIQVSERILEALRSPILLQDQRLVISASIGIVGTSLGLGPIHGNIGIANQVFCLLMFVGNGHNANTGTDNEALIL